MMMMMMMIQRMEEREPDDEMFRTREAGKPAGGDKAYEPGPVPGPVGLLVRRGHRGTTT